MSSVINLASQIEKSLPPDILAFIRKASVVAENSNLKIYLLGGVVRDLLLGQPNLDIDLVVGGNAIVVAEQLVKETGGKVTRHPLFNTAKIHVGNAGIDLAMLRRETYAKPGALPVVQPGTLETDLFRRDFTINAMAVCLNADYYGELIDMLGGLADLKNKLIRVLHEKSFNDDATRIWRAIRYEQRLGFQIEPETLRLLKRDLPMLGTVGGDRIRRELELALHENQPEKVLVRADELGVLGKVHPALKADRFLVDKFQQSRESGNVDPANYLTLLTLRLNDAELQQLRKYLRI